MKYAILGDVHANLTALDAVDAVTRPGRIDRKGDVVSTALSRRSATSGCESVRRSW